MTEERTGYNTIPLAYAKFIGKIGGLKVEEGITQINKVYHTGASQIDRIVSVPKFDGNVINGQEYILVDDHTTNAGTLGALRDYIEDRGGKVVAMTTLSSSVGGNSPRLTEEQLNELKDIDYDGQLEKTLTEAGYSHGFGSLSKRTANFLLDKKNARGFERRRKLEAYGRGIGKNEQFLRGSKQENGRNLGLSQLVADVYNNSLEYAIGKNAYQDFLDDAYSILKKSKLSKRYKVNRDERDIVTEMIMRDISSNEIYQKEYEGIKGLLEQYVKVRLNDKTAKYLISHAAAVMHKDEGTPIMYNESLISRYGIKHPDTYQNENRGEGNPARFSLSNNVGTFDEVNADIRYSLTDTQASAIIEAMKANAEVAPQKILSPENWISEFGVEGIVFTPIGKVKMGNGQYQKMQQQGRNTKLGMVKPTLTNPDVIIEESSKPKEIRNVERNSSYIFIKAFVNADGTRDYMFTSVSNLRNGIEIVVSNQEKETPRIKRLLKEGKLAYINKATLPPEFTASVQGDKFTIPSEVSYLWGKDTTISPNKQIKSQKSENLDETDIRFSLNEVDKVYINAVN